MKPRCGRWGRAANSTDWPKRAGAWGSLGQRSSAGESLRGTLLTEPNPCGEHLGCTLAGPALLSTCCALHIYDRQLPVGPCGNEQGCDARGGLRRHECVQGGAGRGACRRAVAALVRACRAVGVECIVGRCRGRSSVQLRVGFKGVELQGFWRPCVTVPYVTGFRIPLGFHSTLLFLASQHRTSPDQHSPRIVFDAFRLAAYMLAPRNCTRPVTEEL